MPRLGRHGILAGGLILPLQASVSPAGVSGSVAVNQQNAPVQTNAAVVTVSGGAPPFSYAWTWVSGGAGIVIGTPAGSSTIFGAYLSPQTSASGTAKCTITDAAGQIAEVSCTVYLANTYQNVGLPVMTISPTDVSASQLGYGPGTDHYTAFTATVSGGYGPPYTWSWTTADYVNCAIALVDS